MRKEYASINTDSTLSLLALGLKGCPRHEQRMDGPNETNGYLTVSGSFEVNQPHTEDFVAKIGTPGCRIRYTELVIIIPRRVDAYA